ncbi:MAG: hypothetical protein K2X39_07400 [Silvanigrellaceae bacterium]|nr:hypothetical protein [Silvanigrellaceae bacterium]
MFTKNSKNFGVWKQNRKSFIYSHILISKNIFISLSTITFISWLILFLTLAVKKDFFIIESFYFNSNIAKENSNSINHWRESAISVLVYQKNNKDLFLLFDDGIFFNFNYKKNILLDNYLEQRRNKIEVIYMLMKINDPKISRVKIWLDKSFKYKNISKLIGILSEHGYDDFDIVFAG